VTQLLALVSSLKPGTEANFVVQRKEATLKLKLTPGIRPKPKTQKR